MKLVDMVGQRFGSLLVVGRAPQPAHVKSKQAHWSCICDCGGMLVVSGYGLRNQTKSCGCARRKYDLAGLRFERLTVVSRSDDITKPWQCVCDCGSEISVRTGGLIAGHIGSCGCLRREAVKEWGLRRRVDDETRHRNHQVSVSNWRAANAEKIKEYARRRGNRAVAELRSEYIKQLIIGTTGLRASDIPAPLVEAKRAHMRIQRELKERLK